MIDWRTSYHDLSNEIEILSIRREEIEMELQYFKLQGHRQCFPVAKLIANYSGMPGAGRAVQPFEEIGNRIIMLQDQLDDINDVLSLKLEARERMEDKMGAFEGLDHKVMVMRDIQRKKLFEIADELGYSYDWIRKVSRKNKAIKYRVNVKKGTIKAQIS